MYSGSVPYYAVFIIKLILRYLPEYMIGAHPSIPTSISSPILQIELKGEGGFDHWREEQCCHTPSIQGSLLVRLYHQLVSLTVNFGIIFSGLTGVRAISCIQVGTSILVL